MKRGKFALLITAGLLAVTAVVAFAASNPQKAQASFSDKLTYMPKSESYSTPELGLLQYEAIKLETLVSDIRNPSRLPKLWIIESTGDDATEGIPLEHEQWVR